MTEPGRKHPVHKPPVESFNTPIIIFLTVCTKDRQPLLANETAHANLRAAWTRAHRWMVGRYVIMPDHLHLFCAPADEEPCLLQSWVNYWKSVVATAWPDRTVKLWQRDFWDTQLRRSESYDDKWDYVVNNPVRAGMASKSEAWPHQGELNHLRW